MPSFRKEPARAAVTLARARRLTNVSSAEEGGGVILDPAADGKTMMVHLDGQPSMVKRADREDEIVRHELGADDRVFPAPPESRLKDAISSRRP